MVSPSELSSSHRYVCSLQHWPTKSKIRQYLQCTLHTELSFHSVCMGPNTCHVPHWSTPEVRHHSHAVSQSREGKCVDTSCLLHCQALEPGQPCNSSRRCPAYTCSSLQKIDQSWELETGGMVLPLNQETSDLRGVFLPQSACLHARWLHCPYTAAVPEVGMRQKGHEWPIIFSICTSTAQGMLENLKVHFSFLLGYSASLYSQNLFLLISYTHPMLRTGLIFIKQGKK